MRRSPRRWWLYFWFPAVLILLGLIVITPLVIDPLFNKFEPLSKEHPGLVAAIEKLTKHAGVPIPPDRVFLMAASKKTNAINAYVTGLGASKRVVIWDTTIQKTSNDECLFIVGHELGHYVLGHVRHGFLAGAAGLLLALYFLFRCLHWALHRWGKDWKLYARMGDCAQKQLLCCGCHKRPLNTSAGAGCANYRRRTCRNPDWRRLEGVRLRRQSLPRTGPRRRAASQDRPLWPQIRFS